MLTDNHSMLTSGLIIGIMDTILLYGTHYLENKPEWLSDCALW
jgi:hypothetical protein